MTSSANASPPGQATIAKLVGSEYGIILTPFYKSCNRQNKASHCLLHAAAMLIPKATELQSLYSSIKYG